MQLPQDNPELALRLSGAEEAQAEATYQRWKGSGGLTAVEAELDASYARFRLWEAVQGMRSQFVEASAILEGLGEDLLRLSESLRAKP